MITNFSNIRENINIWNQEDQQNTGKLNTKKETPQNVAMPWLRSPTPKQIL